MSVDLITKDLTHVVLGERDQSVLWVSGSLTARHCVVGVEACIKCFEFVWERCIVGEITTGSSFFGEAVNLHCWNNIYTFSPENVTSKEVLTSPEA